MYGNEFFNLNLAYGKAQLLAREKAIVEAEGDGNWHKSATNLFHWGGVDHQQNAWKNSKDKTVH